MLLTVLGGVSALALLFFGLALARFARELSRNQPLDPGAAAPLPAPRVSIILPARDEEANIERCLSSLLGQRYPDYEVIVVDDRSGDRTLEIARRLAASAPAGRCTVVRGEELPPGWLGKNWANWQGQARATGAWLLFTDADTVHAPGCLAAAMGRALEGKADLFTLVPHIVCGSFWEKVLQPVILGAILTAFGREHIERPDSRHAAANGQFMLMPRASYEAIGGHQAIRDRVVDDVSVALAVKERGLQIRVAVGVDVMATRMYTDLRGVWWGYVKNMHTAVRQVGLATPLAPLFPLAAWVAPVAAALAAPWAPAWVWITGALATGAMLAQGVVQNLLVFRIHPAWALARPLGGLLFSGIMAHSMWRGLSGQGPVWKGRVYPAAR